MEIVDRGIDGEWYEGTEEEWSEALSGCFWDKVAAVGADIAGNALNFYENKSSQQHQQNAEEDFAKHQVEWRKQDLINAGFNPLLAAGSSATMGGVSTAAPAPQQLGATLQHSRELSLSSASAGVNAQYVGAQTASTNEETRGKKIENDFKASLLGSQVNAATASAGASEAQARVSEDSRREIDARIRNLDANTSLSEQQGVGEMMKRYLMSLDGQTKVATFGYMMDELKAKSGLTLKESDFNNSGWGWVTVLAHSLGIDLSDLIGGVSGFILGRMVKKGGDAFRGPYGGHTGYFDEQTGEIYDRRK